MTIKKIASCLLGIILSGVVCAQQEPMYGQYLFNASVLSPAQAGADGYNQWGALSRFQFVGIEGAPNTNTAYINVRLPHNLGLAAGIYYDQLGIETHTVLQVDLAYHLRISDNWRLSAGIRTLASNHRLDLLDLPNLDPDDPKFRDNVGSGLLGNSGAGILLSSEKSFFGLSTPRVFKNELPIYDQGYYRFFNKNVRHLFAYAGTNIMLNDEMVFTPSALFKYADDSPVQLDINMIFFARDVFTFGPLIRSNLTEAWLDAVGFLVGLNLGENWHFGYKYEYPTNDLSLVTKQTHELSLRYFWGKPVERFRSPRYFL